MAQLKPAVGICFAKSEWVHLRLRENGRNKDEIDP